MAHMTLYRKWRPKSFDEVIGQEHIVSTLKNEIINNTISHAYVFTGTRGTGKTSTAKILSRAVNCQNPKDGNPCNECDACLGIINETILDVVEMDAASNTGVDSIREIIDQVRYSTAAAKYKVYIIDEVHMLSVGAFNALLKTLEEPPAHVIFILATTEIHKIPATILSRCQRFDFKNISSMDIADAVERILSVEGVGITREAVEYIAYLGNGSMRDALSITEQCLAYKTDDITHSDVTEILGTLDDEFLYTVAEHIAREDVRSALMLYNESMAKGKNPSAFAEGYLKTLRDILFYKLAPEISDMTSVKKKMADRVCELYTKEKIVRAVEVVNDSLKDIKQSMNASVIVEAMIIRLSCPTYDKDFDSLADRISALERKLSEVSAGTFVSPTPSPVREEYIPEPVIEQYEHHDEVKHEEPIHAETPKAGGDIVSSWNSLILELEGSGKLMTFVSLYGVKPRLDGNVLTLIFENRDAASRFANSQGVSDVKEVANKLFGINPEIKCTADAPLEEKTSGNEDIFKKFAKMSENSPEKFKID